MAELEEIYISACDVSDKVDGGIPRVTSCLSNKAIVIPWTGNHSTCALNLEQRPTISDINYVFALC